jgi:hypothetical protein
VVRLSDPYFRCDCDQCRGVAMPPDPYDGLSEARLAALDRANFLGQEHEFGEHAERVLGCPLCYPPAPRRSVDPRAPLEALDDLPF